MCVKQNQMKLRTDADAQADLNRRLARISEGTFSDVATPVYMYLYIPAKMAAPAPKHNGPSLSCLHNVRLRIPHARENDTNRIAMISRARVHIIKAVPPVTWRTIHETNIH